MFKRILRIEPGVSLSWWLYERISGSWPVLLSLFGGGSMTWAASLTEWIVPWGPAGWLASGMSTFLFLWGGTTLIRMGQSWKRGKDVLSDFTQRHLSSATVNPLQQNFTNVRVNAWDFYHPYFEPNKEKTFRNCEVMGPCNILFDGFSDLPRMRLMECDFVIVDPQTKMKGVVGFRDCNFIDCTFYRVTFFTSAKMARELKQQMLESGKFGPEGPMHVISDGTCGEI